jgi:hypothetical protein
MRQAASERCEHITDVKRRLGNAPLAVNDARFGMLAAYFE